MLVNPASVGQQVLAVTFLTSVDSLLCPASIFSCLPLPTISFSGQQSQNGWSLLSCSVNLLSFCLLSNLLSLLHFRSRRRSHSQSSVWVLCLNRQRDRLNGANTNGNELLLIVSLILERTFIVVTTACREN